MRSGPRRVLRRALVALAAALAPLALAGLGLRAWAESRFVPDPEPVPAASVPDTALVGAVRARLAAQADGLTERFSPLADAAHSLEARLELARAAGATLDVQYYGFHHDASGLALLDALEAAAARGVAVRLLVDDIGVGERSDCLARLDGRSDDLEVRVFNPTALRGPLRLAEFVARFPRVTRRMHNKSMTADRIATIVGGRNVSDVYFGADEGFGYADLDVLVAGPAATTVAESFDAYWHGGLAVDVERLTTGADVGCDERPAGGAASGTVGGPAALPGLDAWQGLDGAPREAFPATVAVTIDPPGKVLAPFAREPQDSAAAVVELMRSAERTLRVSSPYFIPGEHGMDVMAELRARGVEVVVMTNSQASTDVPAVFAAYREWRKPMLELGVELHEFLPAMAPATDWSGLASDSTSLHAKNLVVDDRAVFVGSVNLDARSFFHNTEMGVVLESEAFGAEMEGNWDAQLPLVAWRLVLGDGGRVRWHETLPGGGERVHLVDPGTTWLDRAWASVMSWLPVAWLL